MIRTPYSQITPQLTVSQPLINLKIVLSPELFRCACSINVRRISRRKRNHRTSDFLVVCVGALLFRRVAALLQKRKALISSTGRDVAEWLEQSFIERTQEGDFSYN